MATFGEIVYAIVVVLVLNALYELIRCVWLRSRSQKADVDWGLRMQRAAEEHLAAVNEAFFREEEGETDVLNPAYAPFDGCDTCVVREALAGAWPVMSEMATKTSRRRLKLRLQVGNRHDG